MMLVTVALTGLVLSTMMRLALPGAAALAHGCCPAGSPSR